MPSHAEIRLQEHYGITVKDGVDIPLLVEAIRQGRAALFRDVWRPQLNETLYIYDVSVTKRDGTSVKIRVLLSQNKNRIITVLKPNATGCKSTLDPSVRKQNRKRISEQGARTSIFLMLQAKGRTL